MVAVTVEGLLPEEVPADLTDLWRILNADATGQNVSTAQPWFPSNGTVSLEANTTYEFEGQLHISRAAGTTSHTTSILFAHNATFFNIQGQAGAKEGDTIASADLSIVGFTDENAVVVKAASTSATEQILVRVRGIVRINAAGTFIPQFQYSAAPGGVPIIKTGSFFRLRKLGNGTLQSIGTWS